MDPTRGPSNGAKLPEGPMNRRTVLTTALAASITTFALVAQAALTTVAGDNSAQFSASGPGGLSIVGKSTQTVAVVEQGGNVRVSVKLESLDTGMALRNRHMREKYLETGKYPYAELTVPRASLKIPAPGAKASGEATGSIIIHGKAAPVKFTYEAVNEGGVFKVVGKAPIDLRNHDITIPNYLGVTVKPNVDVEVRFLAKD